MSKGYGVYTKVTHWCNRFQIACALSWNIPRLCAIKVKRGHIPLRGTHHLPLPTLCVGLHPMAQENYHWEQLAGFDAIPDEEFTSLNQSYSLLKAVFTWAKLLNTCGMRWSDDFVFCISSLPEPINLQQLIKISCRCWVSYCMSFTQVPFVPWGKYGQQWLIRQEATFATDLVTSLLTSAFSANFENTKNAFCKVQVWLNLWRSTQFSTNILFQ